MLRGKENFSYAERFLEPKPMPLKLWDINRILNSKKKHDLLLQVYAEYFVEARKGYGTNGKNERVEIRTKGALKNELLEMIRNSSYVGYSLLVSRYYKKGKDPEIDALLRFDGKKGKYAGKSYLIIVELKSSNGLNASRKAEKQIKRRSDYIMGNKLFNNYSQIYFVKTLFNKWESEGYGKLIFEEVVNTKIIYPPVSSADYLMDLLYGVEEKVPQVSA